MDSSFTISQTSTETATDRPPVSHKIREYFEGFIIEHVFKPKKIVYGGKRKIHLNICFMAGGPKVLFERIALTKPTTITAEQVKLYEVLILIKIIKESVNPLSASIELMYEAITLFLTTTYKKVTPKFMSDLWKKVDLKYLFSLPYPAPFEDQKYVVDEQLYRVEADGTVRPSTLEEQAQFTGYKGRF